MRYSYQVVLLIIITPFMEILTVNRTPCITPKFDFMVDYFKNKKILHSSLKN